MEEGELRKQVLSGSVTQNKWIPHPPAQAPGQTQQELLHTQVPKLNEHLIHLSAIDRAGWTQKIKNTKTFKLIGDLEMPIHITKEGLLFCAN